MKRTDNLLPKYHIKKRCKHCGDYIRFCYKKKFICKKCGYYVYYDEKDEFKDKMKGLIK